MQILIFLSAIIFYSYVIAVVIKNKAIPIHLSQSFFILEHKFLFSICLLLIAFLALPPLLEITPISYQFLSFISCVSLGFIALTPNYLDKYNGIIHKVAACIAVICSQILILLINPFLMISWFFYIFICLIISRIKEITISQMNPLFWGEIIAFTNIFLLFI